MRKLIRKILREDEWDFVKDHYSLDGIKFTANRYWPSYYRSPSIIYTITDQAVEANYRDLWIGAEDNVDNLVLISWDKKEFTRKVKRDAGETFIKKETVMENFRNGWWEIYEG